MIKILKPYFKHYDERGYLKGIVNFGKWQEINIVSSKKNTIRGNHYHKDTKEIFIILKGKIKVVVFNVINGKIIKKSKKVCLFYEDDAFIVNVNTFHTFYVIEDTKWLNILSKKNDNKKSDFHRIDNVE